MIYRPIERKNKTIYMLGIPDCATDQSMSILQEIILELLDEIEKLKLSNSN